MAEVKTLLFGMTGLGNSALEALTQHDKIKLQAVFTSPRQTNPYPYYPCDHLYYAAKTKGVAVHEGLKIKAPETLDLINFYSPDLIVVSSFNQIITKSIIEIPRHGVINVHPSLLPLYRGTTPTVWAILNGETETGVTVHFIEDETIDSGRIILQSALTISRQETDGSLRFRLSKLSVAAILRAINLVLETDQHDFPKQDESRATYFPKRTERDAEIDVNQSFADIDRRIRAMTPYPGAYIMSDNKKHLVRSAKLLTADALEEKDEKNGFLDWKSKDGTVRFFLGGIING